MARKLGGDRFPINLVYDSDNRFSQFTQLLNKAGTNQFKRDHFRNEALNNTLGNHQGSGGGGMDKALVDFQQHEQQNKFIDFRLVRDQIRAKNVDKAMSLA
jgi:hypothetical protein